MGDHSDKPSPAAPLGYLAPVCAGLLVLSVWLVIGLRYRHFRRGRLNSRFLDLESVPFRRGPLIISSGDVDKKFPLVKYSDWWAAQSKKERMMKETGGSLYCVSDDSRNGHEGKGKGEIVSQEYATKTGAVEDVPITQTGNKVEGSFRGFGNACEHESDAEACKPSESGFLCAICMDSFEGETYIRPLTCGHIFHSSCVDPWLTRRRASCPLCNKSFCGHDASSNREGTGAQTSTVLAAPRAAMIRSDVFPRTI
ncbi:hypothetical protein BDV23DRAFT_135639 [Aspergillus alliaceus]|uniref:RING-type E3 ubiquitin transferase n=1 Tax=Petromyces alliaceus TaxID=209559 RepID=A0A5N7CKI7_PETAA|nr:hypothetical protein BDV23DRAFT_135639 [Aspergillus alliaceus]